MTDGGSRRTVAPYGSWRSPISLDLVFAGRVTPSEPRFDDEAIYWLEGRPEEGGREVIVRRLADGTHEDAVGPGVNVRTMTHEYGGGAWTAVSGTVYYSEVADGRLYRVRPGEAPRPLTPAGPFRYADLDVDEARGRLVSVREDHRGPGEARNTLVTVALEPGATPGEPQVLVEGPDFVAAPRRSPDGRRLAWLAWRHPDMPWDGTELWLAELAEDDTLHAPRRLAGGDGLWVSQPRWSPGGELYCVAEPRGWMNVQRVTSDGLQPILDQAAEHAPPDWVFGRATFAFADGGRLLTVARAGGQDRLWLVEPGRDARALDLPFTEIDGLAASGQQAVFVAASPVDMGGVVRLDLRDGRWEYLRRASSAQLEEAELSVPRHITFPTARGAQAHGLFYPARNPRFEAPAGELPPLIVTSHGGPTSSAVNALRLSNQFFTSRGIAIVDVDYRGSTGYGRDYRRALEGEWGVSDVDDCVAAARYLGAEGLVDPERLAIRGGSASGYTTLCALTFRRDFRAGVSYFGIGDLETFARDTHKFESRYLDRLVGPYPAARRRYRERSPVHHADGLNCPVLLLQGLDDEVVPPSQAEDMVAVLRAKGIPYAYLAFEGEGHGFRRLSNLRRALEAELSFYGLVFGFEPADALPPLPLGG
ncbi:MAG TPA: S9 family peptidase [Candidatus Dormibacteraeota bacterium]|nr:S9 family peptidase [Candidatus Dormibacteraeota bacterium]